MKSVLIFLCCLGWSSYSVAEVLLKNHQGQSIAFSSLKGQWVFINYWASWCPGCVDEIPEFNRFYAEHQKDVALFAVNYDGLSVAQQQALIKRFDIQYPSLVNDPNEALELGDIRGIPVTFVFNPQGALTATLYGGQTLEQLNEVLQHNKKEHVT